MTYIKFAIITLISESPLNMKWKPGHDTMLPLCVAADARAGAVPVPRSDDRVCDHHAAGWQPRGTALLPHPGLAQTAQSRGQQTAFLGICLT